MRFHDATWLYLLPLAPLVGLVALEGWRRGASLFLSPKAASRLADRSVGRRRSVKIIFLSLVLALLAVALARPQYGVKPVHVTRSGIDLMLLLDTSASMAATDVTPSRFARARFEAEKLITALEGNRFGLITFAGESFYECPLTLDMATLKMFLASSRVGGIPVPGTDIGGAITKGIASLAKSPAKSKALVLFTDGEDMGGASHEAARQAAEAKVRIYAIGFGSTDGAPVPEIDETGKAIGYKQTESGEPILTRLDEAALRDMASATGGESYIASGGDDTTVELVPTLARLEQSDLGSQEFTEYEERFQWLLGMALLLLAFDYALGSFLARSPRSRERA